MTAEYIFRLDNESFYTVPPQVTAETPKYPWEKKYIGNHIAITKEHFRCKGSQLNPIKTFNQENYEEKIFDCDGHLAHTLPLKDGKEFVYPILIDILNFLQENLNAPVVITSGHRCPKHNRYVEPSIYNRASKHQLGAEVSFYVKGYEWQPQKVLDSLFNYYKTTPAYKDLKEYREFQRYEQPNTNVSTKPWFNKEIFIKYFKSDEGRNFDNQHKYPFIAIQVRFDRSLNQKVIFNEELAISNYHRK